MSTKKNLSRFVLHCARKFNDSHCLPDKLYLSLLYRYKFDQPLDWDNPQTIIEKWNWLKINCRKPLFNTLADKYAVKKFVADTIGPEYVVPCYGVWERFEDIDFDKLPDQFVLKTNHDSTIPVICKDKSKLDFEEAKQRITAGLNNNYYWLGREWPYKNIKPMVLADMYLNDGTQHAEGGGALQDYKFWCFNGEPKLMYITDKSSDVFENFYDRDFKPVMINHGFRRREPEFERPKNLEKMWELAGVLAKASTSPWIRIDFFDVAGKIYFAEFTFYDHAGLRPFADFNQSLEIGSWLKLPKI